jgi:hypothetical protein
VFRRELRKLPYLGESDVCGSLAEALTADVQAVLADETSSVRADAAVKMRISTFSHDHYLHLNDQLHGVYSPRRKSVL